MIQSETTKECYVNVQELRERYHDQIDVIQNLLHLYIRELDHARATLENPNCMNELSKVTDTVHALVGTSAYCSANLLRDKSYDLELKLKQNSPYINMTNIHELIDLVLQTREEVCDFMNLFDEESTTEGRT